ncbi:MAG: DNA polymerase III subunit [Calditrichaeota bacterium]|nr:DNA polymerase III subunit [Calditrichota bacterium]
MHYQSLVQLPFQKKQSKLLLKSIEARRIHHAYLFHGMEGSAKLASALLFAKHLNCKTDKLNCCDHCSSCAKMRTLQHPDIQLYFPVNKKGDEADSSSIQAGLEHYAKNSFHYFKASGNQAHHVETIRRIKSDAKFAASQDMTKIYLIHQIEYMNDSAANALLKLLEEPPANTILILTCSNLSAILPTIKSRCLMLYFGNLNDTEIRQLAVDFDFPEPEQNIVKLADGNSNELFNLLNQNQSVRSLLLDFLRYTVVNKPIQLGDIIDQLSRSFKKDGVIDFLNMMSFWFRDVNLLISGQNGASSLINVDLQNELAKFSQQFTNLDLLKIDQLIEDTRWQLAHNSHLGLTLTNLSISIRNEIQGNK